MPKIILERIQMQHSLFLQNRFKLGSLAKVYCRSSPKACNSIVVLMEIYQIAPFFPCGPDCISKNFCILPISARDWLQMGGTTSSYGSGLGMPTYMLLVTFLSAIWGFGQSRP